MSQNRGMKTYAWKNSCISVLISRVEASIISSASITIRVDCMYVLGITHHVVVPMETLPIDKRGTYQYTGWGWDGQKKIDFGTELFFNKNPNMILRKFHLLDQLAILDHYILHYTAHYKIIHATLLHSLLLHFILINFTLLFPHCYT